ncbi:histidine kinase [Rhodoplanes elegans]|uniref:TIGR02281 family clan AA aspartic protease n=1 Tax=Rhodoplanes elegans TaxID=29408 RepID=A0A327K386_9BRAD|nr:TIGR02281 family clan AA aspartic protease [Rhodoplanes elegans]MBK5957301.1 histidine kinase [Rhodoplanes elegans]RAI32175.1 TIGR02281 family clan AA aspartic protease [Rhodoplanes elegans]
MRRSAVWLLLLAAIAGLALLLAQRPGTAGLSDGDIASLIVKLGFLAMISGAVLTLFRDRFAQAVQWALIWALIALLLVAGYTYRHDLRDAGERMMAELVPGRAATRGNVVEVARGQAGDFKIVTKVNGASVPMVLDSGASAVVLTHEAAKAAGLPLDFVKYNVNVDTANGRAQAAAVTLDRITVGGIVERSVPALIAPPGQLKVSLLGMSFLDRLESWEVRGGKLSMRAH